MTTIDTAEIVAVGTELLALERQDTNSLFLTGRLAELGVSVRAKAVVSDDRETLAGVLRAALARAPLVITTGGLGPTDDDLTREVAASIAGWPLRERADVLAAIEERFTRRGVSMPPLTVGRPRFPRAPPFSTIQTEARRACCSISADACSCCCLARHARCSPCSKPMWCQGSPGVPQVGDCVVA